MPATCENTELTPTERRIKQRFDMSPERYIRECGRRHMSVEQIALESGHCVRTIRDLIKKHNIPMRYVPVPDGE